MLAPLSAGHGVVALVAPCRRDRAVRRPRQRRRRRPRGCARRCPRAGPWLVALAFAVYSAQWLAVIGFLPSIYAQAGLPAAWAAVRDGAGGGREHRRQHRLGPAAAARRGAAPACCSSASPRWALGAVLAFAPAGGMTPAWRRRCATPACCCSRWCGGLIPARLFSLAVRLAPGERHGVHDGRLDAAGRRSASSPGRRWWRGWRSAPAAGSGPGWSRGALLARLGMVLAARLPPLRIARRGARLNSLRRHRRHEPQARHPALAGARRDRPQPVPVREGGPCEGQIHYAVTPATSRRAARLRERADALAALRAAERDTTLLIAPDTLPTSSTSTISRRAPSG